MSKTALKHSLPSHRWPRQVPQSVVPVRVAQGLFQRALLGLIICLHVALIPTAWLFPEVPALHPIIVVWFAMLVVLALASIGMIVWAFRVQRRVNRWLSAANDPEFSGEDTLNWPLRRQ